MRSDEDVAVVPARSISVARRTAVSVSVVLAVVLGVLILSKAIAVFLLMFVAILFAVLFQGLADLFGNGFPSPTGCGYRSS